MALALLLSLKSRRGIYSSAGIDNTLDPGTASYRDWRTRNFIAAANAIYKFTRKFAVGAEFPPLRNRPL